MTTIITRLYAHHDTAAAAVSELTSPKSVLGFPARDVSLVSAHAHHGHADGAREDHIRQSVAASGVAAGDVAALTRGVLDGGSLVIVRADWGRAADAIEILDGFPSIASGAASPEYNPGAESFNDPAPFSSLLGLPTIFTASQMQSSLAAPTLVGSGWELSKAFGIPLLASKDSSSTKLSDNAAPLSSIFKIPTLAKS